MNISREVQLKRYPQGLPQADDFELVEKEISDSLQDGTALIRNLYMSVDPYMRGRMSGKKTYIDPFPLNEALTGGAVGVVEKSRHPELPEGSYVMNFQGWRESFVVSSPEGLNRIKEIPGLPLSIYLGALGMPGLTAYAGLLHIASLKDGERVFVSGAAGAVGTLVGQIAKAKSCYVVGSCGSQEKAKYLSDELGFDEVLNYHDAPIAEQLKRVAGVGFDVYFDNVGGDHLEAALDHMRDFGRIALCGAISQYNNVDVAQGPRNLTNAIVKRLSLRGFIATDHLNLHEEFVERMASWMKAGQLSAKETVVEGLDHAVEGFLGLFSGKNVGKMIVKL
ncbi:MAG: NADP-dependent oxidoreductase [Oligoflexus sp.]